MGLMPGYYLRDEKPDLEDFFSQVVPAPPKTDVPGGMTFMAPFDHSLSLWFAYCRTGEHVDRFDGSEAEVRDWVQKLSVAEHWVWEPRQSRYVRQPPAKK